MAKPPKPKPVNYDLIPQTDAAYKLLDEVRDKWHEDMYGAKIALAYRKRLKPDKDGHINAGPMRQGAGPAEGIHSTSTSSSC